MIPTGKLRGLALALLSCLSLAANASAQITTGTVAGTIKDAQGGVIPGATVVLVSETKGTKSAPVVTSETGDYVFPNVTPDTYTVEVTMGFKTRRRTGVGHRRRPSCSATRSIRRRGRASASARRRPSCGRRRRALSPVTTTEVDAVSRPNFTS